TLLVEAITIPGKASFKLTGQMGAVMKESASIALSWLRRYSAQQRIASPNWFEKRAIHLHIPEGATPKDGPSAGITMTTTLFSLLTQQKVKPRLAMTGELSLTGQVLPIGGLKEKTIAARRGGIKEIIMPKANVRDLDEIPEHVKKGMVFHLVESMEEVLSLAFPKGKRVRAGTAAQSASPETLTG
ncbi:endopeptidase La, partial [Treponema pallidum]